MKLVSLMWFYRHLGRFGAAPRATLIVRFHSITIQEMKPSFGLISPSPWLGHLQDRKRHIFQISPTDIWIHVQNHWQFLPYTVRLFCPYEHTTKSNGSIMVVLRYVLTRCRALNDRSLVAFVAGVTRINLANLMTCDNSCCWCEDKDRKYTSTLESVTFSTRGILWVKCLDVPPALVLQNRSVSTSCCF